MQIRWGRLIAGVVAAEAVPILLLIIAVALFGPSEAAGASAYAARLGRWIGPLGGALSTFLSAWWVARPAGPFAVRCGLLVGCLTAGLDIGILVASGAAFEWIFAASNAGRVVAGMLGGRVAAPRSVPV